MEINELHEHAEHAHHSGEKALGLTTAIVAVLLSLATLLGHRAQTDAMLALTQNVDDWNFYQSKHNRAYMFGLAAEMEAMLPNGRDSALRNLQNSIEEECGAPVSKGCTSPILKKSAVLETVIPQEKPDANAKTTASHAEPQPAASAREATQDPEKTAKEKVSKDGAAQIQEKARDGQAEVSLLQRKIDRYDGAELFLEMSIVLCSIALLAESKIYWKLSFISTAIGVAAAVWGLLLR